MDMYTLILFALFVVFACLTTLTAERRGRSVKVWMWLGVIFGPFAWLTVVLLPSMSTQSRSPQ